MPEIPLSYYKFKREQEYDGEDLEIGCATTDPEDSSDDNTPIVKPRSNIKKVAHIVRVESKMAKMAKMASGKNSFMTKLPTKRAAAEPLAMRPSAEPLGDISINVGGRPKHKIKKPKKSLP